MKKLAILFVLIGIYTLSFGQYSDIENGESGLSARTKINNMHTEIYENATAIEFSIGGSSWHKDYVSTDEYMRFSADMGSTWGDSVKMVQGDLIFDGDTISIENITEAVLETLADAVMTDTIFMNGDTIFSDGEVLYFNDDSIMTRGLLDEYLEEKEIEKDVYSITLPYSNTVAGRVALTTAGVDYPEGWTLTADGLNLVITHNLDRNVANITVKGQYSGTVKRQLKNTNAYDYFQDNSTNETKIFSLSNHLDILYLSIIFE